MRLTAIGDRFVHVLTIASIESVTLETHSQTIVSYFSIILTFFWYNTVSNL